MNIALFLEGSPGHEKQSLAVIEELRELTDVKVDTYRVDRPSFIRRVVDLVLLAVLPGGGCRYDTKRADLVFGTGTSTHIPLLSCKKKYGTPAVICMSPAKVLRPYFDLCFVPRHDEIAESDTVMATDGPPARPVGSRGKDQGRGVILIGGADPGVYDWQEEELVARVEKIISGEPDVLWKVSSSPRTPDSTEELLSSRIADHSNCSFHYFRDTPRGWLESEYEICRYAWVTVDSMSMVYEALTNGCQVGLLPLDWKKENKFKRSMESLVDRGGATTYEKWETGEGYAHGFEEFNEAARCAGEIVSRWSKT